MRYHIFLYLKLKLKLKFEQLSVKFMVHNDYFEIIKEAQKTSDKHELKTLYKKAFIKSHL